MTTWAGKTLLFFLMGLTACGDSADHPGQDASVFDGNADSVTGDGPADAPPGAGDARADAAADAPSGQTADAAADSAPPGPDAALPPDPPSSLVANSGDAQVVLEWNRSIGATSYTVRRSNMSGAGYADLASGVLDLSYTDTTVTNGNTYYYMVRAVNSFGASADSDEVVGKPLFQRVDSTTFRTFASANSSGGVVPAASCTTANASCHVVDGDASDDAHAWFATGTGPYVEVDSGDLNWGKHVDHFTVIYFTSVCAGNLDVRYKANGSGTYIAIPGVPCAPGVKTGVEVPLDEDAWALSFGNPATANLTVYEVQFWTTN